MKILLVGINAKYIHSNPAVYSLRASALQSMENNKNVSIEIAEYTINQTTEQIIRSIYKAQPDLIGISCYIWNVTMVQKIAVELGKLLRDVPVWLGGPEVSFDLEWQMQRFPTITGIMYGEGEKTFSELIKAYMKKSDNMTLNAFAEENDDMILNAFAKENDNDIIFDASGRKNSDVFVEERDKKQGRERFKEGVEEHFKYIKGIVYRDPAGQMIVNEPGDVVDLDALPFPYENIEDFQNRIIYYETSRGCPYSCAYCLSSVEKNLRFRSPDKVFAELQIFLDAKVKQVKFIDRTFNCNHRHAMAILQYLKEHDNGVTNFHFEVAGDLLMEEEITLIGSLRPGLIQLEIGVQSTNEKTLSAVRRRTDLTVLKNNIAKLLEKGNVHLHVDLIAGLPFENMDSFIQSFNDVYQMGGHELQLGFLKLLHGTPMMQMKKEHDIVCTDFPPYEVLHTKELSYEDILRLKAVEEMLEIYHNSGQFRRTEDFLLPMFASPFDFYERLAAYYEEKNYPVVCSARERRYVILLEYLEEYLKSADRQNKDNEEITKMDRQNTGNEDIIETVRELLTVDYYLRERAKARPSFASDEKKQYRKLQETDFNHVMVRETGFREWTRKIFQRYAEEENCDAGQPEKGMHLEILHKAAVMPGLSLPQVILFDYEQRDPVTKEVKITAVVADRTQVETHTFR